MHAIEKILAKKAGVERVRAGEIVNCSIDFVEINDLYLQTIYSFWEMGGKKVYDKDKIAFVFDHYSPAPTIKTAQIHKEMRAFAKEQGLTHHFDINKGVCHQVMPEAGLIYPGMIIVATDSHTTTHGAFGAFGTGVGATDMASILIRGKLWFRVPEIIKIEINGIPSENVYAKDVILYILGRVKADGAVYKAIEFCGDYVENLGVSERMTICNMAVEMGAKTAYMVPNQAVIDYINARTDKDYEILETDADYIYDEHLVFNVDGLRPQLAAPHSVDNNISVQEGFGVKIDQAYIGSCTGGRVEDIEAAWKVLKDKKVHPDVRLVIIPASDEVQLSIIEKGYMRDLINAGATFNAPRCGPCLGTHAGLIADDEVCITSTNRNFPGRMGSNKASIYLASPMTVATSALYGYITEPK
ncbi:MAG: 3-isopropylmalate dehydratase large subunit [Tissierella sp.]|nr:3-isopropylmalate dehydratase large subunit [Tissierella sp.]